MMRFCLILASTATIFTVACESICADGGQVRTVRRHGDEEITVFTSPTPMCAGWADISVAVQNIATGQVSNEARVMVELKHHDATVPVIHTTATTQAATNKLLRVALVELPKEGVWDITVRVFSSNASKPSEIYFTMDVAAPWPAWITEWPWFCWPAVPILLFVVHRVLVAIHSSDRHANECGQVQVATARIPPSI